MEKRTKRLIRTNSAGQFKIWKWPTRLTVTYIILHTTCVPAVLLLNGGYGEQRATASSFSRIAAGCAIFLVSELFKLYTKTEWWFCAGMFSFYLAECNWEITITRNYKYNSENWALAIKGVQITRLRSGEVRARGVGDSWWEEEGEG